MARQKRKLQKPEAKPQFSALPTKALLEVARICALGDKKHGGRTSWKKPCPWSKLYDHMQRHAHKFWAGEDRDGEDGFYHLAAVVHRALNLLEFQLENKGDDDRLA